MTIVTQEQTPSVANFVTSFTAIFFYGRRQHYCWRMTEGKQSQEPEVCRKKAKIFIVLTVAKALRLFRFSRTRG